MPRFSRRTMLDIAESYENLARRGHGVGATLLLSEYDEEPGRMEAMRAAFKRACDVL
jgi:hypothetical protein